MDCGVVSYSWGIEQCRCPLSCGVEHANDVLTVEVHVHVLTLLSLGPGGTNNSGKNVAKRLFKKVEH